MKVYDGAAMVADKTGSMVVPIRIEGLEKSSFSRLTSLHVRRRLFPKVKVTILEPVKLKVPDELRGRQRRAAAGAALYQVMSDLVFRTQDIDTTVLEKIIPTANERGMKQLAVQDPVTGSLTYGKLLTAAAVLGEKFRTLYADQQTLGIMLPNANGSCATLLGVMSAGKVPAMINFTAGAANILSACKAAEVRTVLTSRAFVEQAKLGAVVEEVGRSVDIVWLDDLRATHRPEGQAARRAAQGQPAGCPQGRRSGGDPVHLGLRRHAEGRRAHPPQHPGQRRPGGVAHRLPFGRQGLQRPADIPFLRPDGGHGAAADVGRAGLFLSLAAALPARAGADLRVERDHHLRHRHVPRRLCAHRAPLRLPLGPLLLLGRRAGQGVDAARPTWRSSACASSKATA